MRKKGLVLISILALLASGCTVISDLPAVEPGDVEPAVITAVVESRTISDVLTLPMSVQAGTSYTVSAQSVGRLLADQRLNYSFDPSGEEGPIPLVAPPTSLSREPLVPLNTDVGPGTPVLRIVDSSLTVTAELTPQQVLRLADRAPLAVRAQISGSSGPFDCQLNDPRPTSDNGSYFISCRLPVEVPAVVGSTGLLALTLDERVDVAALPLEAVAGSRSQGLVYLGTGAETRQVTLGITDGVFIEIVDGLAVGDTVTIPSPSILNE